MTMMNSCNRIHWMGIRTSTDAGLALIQDIDKSEGYQQRDKKVMNSHTDDGDARFRSGLPRNGPSLLILGTSTRPHVSKLSLSREVHNHVSVSEGVIRFHKRTVF